MVRHIIIAAWRNMAANKLISAIAILGLAVGIAAALLMALVVRNQLTFDHFIAGHERTYLVVRAEANSPGLAPWYFDQTGHNIAALLKFNAPEIEDTTRLVLAKQGENKDTSVELKHDETAAREAIYWADPNVFDVLPLPTYRGNPKTALMQPDGIVLPRSIARKYFGHDDAIGEVILVAGHPMTVRAVIQDLPTNATELQSGIFASDLAPFSEMAKLKDARGIYSLDANTYLRLKPGASITGLAQKLPQLLAAMPAMTLLRLDEIPLFKGLHPGARERLIMVGLIGLLVLFVASVNFINLLTARAARRNVEVGVRKVCGAGRRQLILQFLCESIVCVFFAACFAAALCEWLLPPINAFLATGAVLDYWRSPVPMAAIVAGIGALGLAAGTYPALVLSAFRPASTMKGVASHSSGANAIRSILVALQFSILIALLIGACVVYQQRVYATSEGLHANIDQMLVVKGECSPVFRTELRKLPGVAGVSCSSGDLIKSNSRVDLRYKNQSMLVDIVGTDWGALSLYGIQPLAGSLATNAPHGDYDASVANSIVINLAAMKRLGIVSPQAAIGKYLSLSNPTRIVAVVPDFAFYSVERMIEPTLYRPIISAPPNYSLVSIKLKGQQIPETLAAIDRLWTATGHNGPIKRDFLNLQMEELYLNMTREAEMFAIFSGLAIALACLGLFGIAISTAERRTKEIGVRKAMGATTGNIVTLLLWQFAQPVLWANVIAWPVAWWLMRRWLSGFAYHIDLRWWVFAGASAGALLIALLTVAGQALLTARAKPVLALRTE